MENRAIDFDNIQYKMLNLNSNEEIQQHLNIYNYTWNEDFSIDYFLSLFSDCNIINMYDSDTNTIIGFIILQKINEKAIRICNFVIHQDKRNEGYGTKLLEYVIEKYRNLNLKFIRLIVLDDNIPAKKIYKKFGFLEQQKKYNVISMEKEL